VPGIKEVSGMADLLALPAGIILQPEYAADELLRWSVIGFFIHKIFISSVYKFCI